MPAFTDGTVSKISSPSFLILYEIFLHLLHRMCFASNFESGNIKPRFSRKHFYGRKASWKISTSSNVID